MIIKYTKKEFLELDFDSKCVIIESLLTDDYFQGQMDIDFQFEEDEYGKIIPPPIEIKEIEDRKFESLIEKLSEKLFENKQEIEYDDED